MLMYKNKKAEPFDAYQNPGYRQVDLLQNKHEQSTPIERELSTACSFCNECFWRYSDSKNKSKSSISML